MSDTPSPGYCDSDLVRSATGDRLEQYQTQVKQYALTLEEGSRHIVYAALKGLGDSDEERKLNGVFLSVSRVEQVGDFVLSDVGERVQDRLWVSVVYFILADVIDDS